MADDVTKKLREQVGSMTTRDWLVRVSELRQALESRDRTIAEQARTIARLRTIADELRAKVAQLEATPKNPEIPQTPQPTRPREGSPSGGQAPESS